MQRERERERDSRGRNVGHTLRIKRSSLDYDIVVKLARSTAIRNSPSTASFAYPKWNNRLLLTVESSRSAKLIAYSGGREELRVQEALPQCALSTETPKIRCESGSVLIETGRQEPIHRITRCHNHDSESTSLSEQIISTPFDSPIGCACKNPEMIYFNTIEVLGREGGDCILM